MVAAASCAPVPWRAPCSAGIPACGKDEHPAANNHLTDMGLNPYIRIRIALWPGRGAFHVVPRTAAWSHLAAGRVVGRRHPRD